MDAKTRSVPELLNMIDWYRRCLEDVIDRRPVRDLAEAKAGYDRAWADLHILYAKTSNQDTRDA